MGLLVALLALPCLSACSSLETRVLKPPPTGVTTLVIGAIATPPDAAEGKPRSGGRPAPVVRPDDEDVRLARRFRRALIAKLEAAKSFERVVSPAPATPPPMAVVLSGGFSELDPGSDALRFIIGGSAGEPRARGRFEVRDGEGQLLLVLDEVAGGWGRAYSSQLNAVDIDQLVDRLAGRTAEAVITWKKTAADVPPRADAGGNAEGGETARLRARR